MNAPQYQQPPLDPSFGLLQQQAQQQDLASAQVGVNRDTTNATARYGTLTSSDSAGILARYAAQLTMAGAGGMANQLKAA